MLMTFMMMILLNILVVDNDEYVKGTEHSDDDNTWDSHTRCVVRLPGRHEHGDIGDPLHQNRS